MSMIDKAIIQEIFEAEILRSASHDRYRAQLDLAGIDVAFYSNRKQSARDFSRTRWLVTISTSRWRLTMEIKGRWTVGWRISMIESIVYTRGDIAEIIEDFAAMRLLVA